MREPDIFISYSKEDRTAARRIAACLENEGLSVWWDAVLQSGDTFDEVIERQLRTAKAAVVLWSPRSVTSRWVRAEATLADRRKIFVPVVIEHCDLPIIFQLSHTNDLSTWDGNPNDFAWRRLMDDIRNMVGSARSKEQAPAQQAKGFLLAESRTGEVPAQNSNPFPLRQDEEQSPHHRARSMPDSSAETEQTAYFNRSETGLSSNSTEVHCLEVGPAETPIARHPIGLVGVKLGRAAPSDIIFSDKLISRRHCEVEIRNGDLLVTDLQSTNGTFIDGQKIETCTVLPPESELMLGDVVLTHRVRSLVEIG